VQLFAVIVNEYNLDFPRVVKEVTSYISFLNLSVFSLFEFGCKAHFIDPLMRLMLVSLTPVVIVIVLMTARWMMGWEMLTITADVRKKWRHRFFSFALITMFLVLPSVRCHSCTLRVAVPSACLSVRASVVLALSFSRSLALSLSPYLCAPASPSASLSVSPALPVMS
jgi:hypothetical protein